MSNQDEDNQISLKWEKPLPKSAKNNLTASGKRKPLTLEKALRLYDKPLTLKTLRRIASIYYRTSANDHGNTISLHNEITGDWICICLTPVNGYLHAYTTKQKNGSEIRLEILFSDVNTTNGLLVRLVSKKYL